MSWPEIIEWLASTFGHFAFTMAILWLLWESFWAAVKYHAKRTDALKLYIEWRRNRECFNKWKRQRKEASR